MANERRSGGRGGVATDPASLDLEDFQIVPKAKELSRGSTTPTEYAPLVEFAVANLNQKIERTRKVMDPETNEPRVDEAGNAIREPVTYTKTEALAFYEALRTEANRQKLTKARKSLRRVFDPDPRADDATEEGPYRVQFYVIPMGAGGATQDGNSA